jgi:hypothetical protein
MPKKMGLKKEGRRMNTEDKIYEIIQGWVGHPTWFTNHPTDLKRRHDMLDRLYADFGQGMDEVAFREAIERHCREGAHVPGEKPSPEKVDELIFQALTDFRQIGFTS